MAGRETVLKGSAVVQVNRAWLFGLDLLQNCSFAAVELLTAVSEAN